jgi:hypothetical protein
MQSIQGYKSVRTSEAGMVTMPASDDNAAGVW